MTTIDIPDDYGHPSLLVRPYWLVMYDEKKGLIHWLGMTTNGSQYRVADDVSQAHRFPSRDAVDEASVADAFIMRNLAPCRRRIYRIDDSGMDEVS